MELNEPTEAFKHYEINEAAPDLFDCATCSYTNRKIAKITMSCDIDALLVPLKISEVAQAREKHNRIRRQLSIRKA